MRRTGIGSSSVAIGTATAFIAIAAGLSFVADDGAARPPAAWTLRGSIASEQAPPAAKDRQAAPGQATQRLVTPRLVTRQQVARSDID